MANKTPPVRTNSLHNPNGGLLSASEATAVAAGDTIVVQNNGNQIIRFVVTTAGTGTVVALNSANNIALTFSVGENLLGPYDPSLFGSTLTITTAAAVGSVGLYAVGSRYPNALRNPFETNPTAVDAT